MRTPALVSVAAAPDRFAALLAAARERGVRVGWLDLRAPDSTDDALEMAAAQGVLRAVAVGGGRAVAVKPVGGEPVLRDLLREHFLGCALVLVRGRDGLPRLSPAEGGFRLESAGGRARDLDAEGALTELLRPRHRA